MIKIQVGNRRVGDGEPCFIIAEAGSNHNGNVAQAKALIDIAADAGADAVKFQIFRAGKLYPKSAGISDYLNQPRSIYDIIAEMEFPYEWIPQLADYCAERNVVFLASAFDEESAEQLDPYVKAHKIASYEMNHMPLLRQIAKSGKPTFISTGTANLEEIEESVAAFRQAGNYQIVLNQCTAAYPAPLESLNIRAITLLKDTFGVPVGLSDHSSDPLVGPMAAVAMGANTIEKHFTFNKELPGPDHSFAMEPAELRLMVQKVREVERALGKGSKVALGVEEELRQFARRTIFTTSQVEAGEAFSPDNVAVLRAGTHPHGLPPDAWTEVLDKRAKRRMPPETVLHWEDIE